VVAVPSIGRASGVVPRRAPREAEATRALYEQYARPIYGYCFRQLGSKEEAEDATQSTFLNAFRGYIRGVDPEYESAWIYKIAENVCLTRQRSSSRRRRVEAASDLDAMQDFVPAHEADSDELIRLPEALDAMPEHQRRALLLREWQGLSYKEIAEELDVSQAAVETLLFRARRSLAAGLTDEPQQKKDLAKRMRAGGDVGSLLTLVKSILVTGGAKVAATVATVAATSVVAATPVARHAVEHVVSPVAPPAKHHVTKQPSAAPSAGKPHVAGAGAASVVAHHVNLARQVSLTRAAHRPLAKRVKSARLDTSAAPVHASSVSHVDIATTDDQATATAATPTPVADPAPTPSAEPTPTTNTSSPPTTQSTPAATPPPPPTTKDNGQGTSTSTSSTSNGSGNGKSTTLTLSTTQPTPAATPGTTPTPTTTTQTSKTVVQIPTTTLAPPATQPATTPAPAATPAPAPSITLAPATTVTPVATPLPESPGKTDGHKK
jgi:RNA polymerase sigma factor (sigma-70 family)